MLATIISQKKQSWNVKYKGQSMDLKINWRNVNCVNINITYSKKATDKNEPFSIPYEDI